MTTADFGIRIPSMTEIREAFGSAARAIECTRGDLPTVLYFLANPDRIAGFKSPKGARRVGHADFARKLREAADEDRAAARARIDREVAASVAERVRAHLARHQDPKRPVLVSKVARYHAEQRVPRHRETGAGGAGHHWRRLDRPRIEATKTARPARAYQSL